jgi:acetoin utilization deacetylase AcuC-like enzyme
MKLLYHPDVLRHRTGQHPESIHRLDHFEGLEPLSEAPDGSPYFELVHSFDYIEKVRLYCETEQALDNDTLTSIHSFDAVKTAVGVTIKAMEQNDFALIRPPGHHAYREEGRGFCLFNNVAIAAQKAVNEGKRVLILDFDGHLGDGTMDIFLESDQVFFWSLHQYPAYPGHGYANEIGTGAGKYYTMNTPLPPGSGDDIWWHAINYLWPVVHQFEPDLVAVSAGFDAHQFDPLLQLNATGHFYHKIGQLLGKTFEGRLFAALEGGYNTEELPKCVANFVAGVNQEAMPFPEPTTTSGLRIWETYEMHLHTVAGAMSKHWKF